MQDLPAFSRRLLDALADAPLAWQTPEQLARLLGADFETTCDAVADLDASGWLDPWELDGTIHVILSPRAAERLRVRLVPIGRSERFRWSSLDDPEPAQVVTGRSHGGATLLDLLADPTPGPELLAEASERAEGLAAARAEAGVRPREEFLPRPKILLGLGLTPWPGPRAEPTRVCPGCRSAALDETAYCLVCDRWGLDHRLKPRRRSGAGAGDGTNPILGRGKTNPIPPGKGTNPILAGGKTNPISTAEARAVRDKEKRKAKRRSKLQAMAARDRAAKAGHRQDGGTSGNPPSRRAAR